MSRVKLVRALVAVATFAVVWLVVSPASALPRRAPVCDPRGAIGFAPPPQFQDLELSLDVPPECVDDGLFDARSVVPGRSAQVDFSISHDPLLATSPVVAAPAAAERLGARASERGGPRAAIRSPLERPPRG